MIKTLEDYRIQLCKNCGAEIQPGSSFCEQGGTPVPQTRQCSSCGTDVSLKARFCPNCGASLDSSRQMNNGAISIVDKNVIAGDMIGSKEETKVYGSATIIRNEEQTKKSKNAISVVVRPHQVFLTRTRTTI